MKAVLILSGGLDSSTLGYWLQANGYDELICVSFNYGQKQIVELESAKLIAKNLNAQHHILDISHLQKLLASASSLTNNDHAVPVGEYTKENMQSTVVPNRNSTLLTLAWSIACVEMADALAYGAHGGDHYLYPDTRPEYFAAINLSLRLGSEGSRCENLNLIAPFINMDKAAIIREAVKLNVPLVTTWSCYKGGSIHCGECGACIERKKAFKLANITDPTKYMI